MIVVPDHIEEALRRAASEHIEARDRRGATLTRAILRRSRLYTSERHELGDAPAGPADLAARALFFSVADAAKVFVPLQELERRSLLPLGDPVRILDVGAGAGAMTLGALCLMAELGATRFALRAVDRDRDALRLMASAVANLAELLGVEAALETTWRDIREGLEPARADLVFGGSVLNELEPGAAEALLEAMVEAIEPGGAAVVIEPALRETSRALHRLRDRVIERRLAHVFAPCTRTTAPCPALEDERDWCHEDRPVQLPSRTARLVTQTGLREHGLKMSYLTLRRDDAPQVLVPAGHDARRLVSRPRKLKGCLECFACGETGRQRLRFLKRNRDSYRAMVRAHRGDVLVFDPDGELA